MQVHGGQDNHIEIEFKTDFSVTTNFMGLSEIGQKNVEKNIADIQHYPPQDWEPFLSRFKNFVFKDFLPNDNFILGNGASELIDILIRNIDGESWKPNKTAVQFLEYEESCKKLRKIKKSWDDNSADLTCLINPNNPTGQYMKLDELKEYILTHCNNDYKETHVIVDESMQPWIGPEWRKDSLISQSQWIHDLQKKKIYVYIIHSWTKLFCCTGLRYGTLICPNSTIYDTIRKQLIPWNINYLALHYIDGCILDTKYLENTWKQTSILRKSQIEKLMLMFPSWKFYGEPFLSWIWIDTYNKDIAQLVYTIAKYNGTPIRIGKSGYNMDTYIRIAVRTEEKFDEFLNNLKTISNICTTYKPFHYNFDNNIIVEFKYLNSDLLVPHENVIELRKNKLLDYINTIETTSMIPSIIVCSQSFHIIDGHHRYSALKQMGIHFIPCTLINYQHPNIIVNPNNLSITKDMILQSNGNNLLPPKSSCHHIMDMEGTLHPIQALSTIVKYSYKN